MQFPQKALKKKPALIAGSEFARLLRDLSDTHRTMVSLIAATGLRIGELLALRWSSLDLEVGALTVRESVFEGQFQSPKTQRALRTIPLGPHAVKALSDVYTDAVDASHRQAIEAVQRELFVLDHRGLQMAAGLDGGVPASDAVNGT